MRIADWITLHPHMVSTVSPEAELAAIAETMLATACQRDIFVADEEGALIGHIGRHRLAGLLLAEFRPEHTRRQIMERIVAGTAKDVMEPHFAAARPEEELDEVLHRQLAQDMEDMPVIGEDGLPLGVINLTQVLQVLLRETTAPE